MDDDKLVEEKTRGRILMKNIDDDAVFMPTQFSHMTTYPPIARFKAMWSKGTLYFAVFVALAAVLVAYYLYYSHNNESFLHEDSSLVDNVEKTVDDKKVASNDDDDDTTSSAYKSRVLVMRLFNTLLMRKASESEIEKYSSIVGEENIVKQIIRDYKVDGKSVAKSVAKSVEKSVEESAPEKTADDSSESFTTDPNSTVQVDAHTKGEKGTGTRQQGGKQETTVESYAGFLPFEEVDFTSKSSSSNRTTRQTPLTKLQSVLTPAELLPSNNSIDNAKDDDAKGKNDEDKDRIISIDKNELRARLDAISREVIKLNQLLSN